MPRFKIGDRVMVKATGRRANSAWFEEVGVVTHTFKGVIHVTYDRLNTAASFMSVDLEYFRDYATEVLGEGYFA